MRKLPKSFFWIDQQVVRGGTWTMLSCHARLIYVAISASCDREGISIWSRNKLMELAGASDPEQWQNYIDELCSFNLIEVLPEQAPAAIRILNLEGGNTSPPNLAGHSHKSSATPDPTPAQSTAPIVIHTHTSIHLSNEKVHHADSRSPG